MAGKAAVENAINGINGRMIGFERGVRDGKYACKTKLIPLMEVANTEKKLPRQLDQRRRQRRKPPVCRIRAAPDPG